MRTEDKCQYKNVHFDCSVMYIFEKSSEVQAILNKLSKFTTFSQNEYDLTHNIENCRMLKN